MAKKKKKTKSKPAARYNLKRGASAGTKKALAPRKAGPRSQVLPGMKRARNQQLDNIFEGIGEERRKMNEAKQEEQALIGSALRIMVAKEIPAYKHAGVEGVRAPGAEKLRVRLTKEQGDADESDLEAPDGRGETDNDQIGDERRAAVEELDGSEGFNGEGAGEVH